MFTKFVEFVKFSINEEFPVKLEVEFVKIELLTVELVVVFKTNELELLDVKLVVVFNKNELLTTEEFEVKFAV
jgi:hypothetical protein